MNHLYNREREREREREKHKKSHQEKEESFENFVEHRDVDVVESETRMTGDECDEFCPRRYDGDGSQVTFNVTGIWQKVVGNPENKAHQTNDQNLEPVFRCTGIPLQRNTHLE